MNKQQKTALVGALRERLEKSRASFVVEYKGLTVRQMQALRRALQAKGGASIQIAKARLIKRAANGIEGVEGLAPYLNEQIGVVFASDEVSAIAKVLNDFAKDNQALVLKAGCVDSKILGAAQVKRIAELPSREVLLAQLCGVLNAPITQLARALEWNLVRLVHVLEQVEEQKKSQQ